MFDRQKNKEKQNLLAEQINYLTNILSIEPDFANRIASVCSYQDNPENNAHWNCFGALQFLISSNTKPQLIIDMPEFGIKKDLNFSIDSFSKPVVFQICGTYSLPGEFGMGEFEYQGVIHTGILLGEDKKSSKHKIFEKVDWDGDVQIESWDKMIKRFQGEIKYLRFFQLNNLEFQSWCRSWEY